MLLTRSLFATGILIGLLPGLVANAQAPLAAGVPVGCTYATCALRLEPAFFGTRLVRGASGEALPRLDGFGGGIEPLLTGPDSAVAYGRRYVRASQRSAVLGLVGAIGYVVVLVQTDNFRKRPISDAEVGTLVASGAFVLASVPFAVQAQRNLSRAIWWYNGALPR